MIIVLYPWHTLQKSVPLVDFIFLVPVSGKCVMQIWHQILMPIRTLVLFQTICWHALDGSDDFVFPFELVVFGFNARYNIRDHYG